MKKPNEYVLNQSVNDIINFLDSSTHFKYEVGTESIKILQTEDKKNIQFSFENVEKVLLRNDYDGASFIQVNFKSQSKILLTKSLVGFKPLEIVGFDTAKIPKVVTTVDLQSITQAIEDLYDSEDTAQTLTEIEVLKKVYQSILFGAESIGFDMKSEKQWFSRFLLNHSAASA